MFYSVRRSSRTFTYSARIEDRFTFPGKTSAARNLGTSRQCCQPRPQGFFPEGKALGTRLAMLSHSKSIGSLSIDVFWETFFNQKLAFCFLIFLSTTKFVLLSVFILKDTIYPKICSKSRLRCVKSALPVHVNRSKTKLLKILLKIMTKNGIYSPPMKVISNTILFVYSFARRPRQNWARVSNAIAELFRWTPPPTPAITGKVQKVSTIVAFSYADYSRLHSNWHTYINPRPGQYLTQAQSHVTRALADSCHDAGATLLGIIKISNISKSTATNQSEWYSRLTNEPRTLAPAIVSMSRACLFYLKARNCKGSGLLSH